MPFPLPTDDREPSRCPSGLYVVATPIGNLEDITLRAIHTLDGVDLIAAEDTRHTRRLLSRYRIDTPLISCHEHNEHHRTPELIAKIQSGAAVALVSDAGTPSVSDPGYRLVCAAVAHRLDIFPIPGVSAVVTALSASGLPTDAFVFLGFAPKKKGKRREWLESLAAESRTLVFYESPRRVAGFLEELRSVMGDRQAVLAREMTKVHEEFMRGSIAHIQKVLAGRPEVKGECTLLVGGAPAADTVSDADLGDLLREALSQPGARISSISKTIARQYRLPRKTVYEMALTIQRETGRTP
ncbi:ribosomal RNA small subunit methyltransferase I [Desulfosarcina alkanivorans]|uniref:Ribosomal RNA small subunit methyltransferase I n=1 Tax=Desulfosarcina alkanivorans TaxID=571177 RepID=A0A5K7YUV1_9BACT|nr:16S rRNA (cytidine(1402)-2'-O)-methyltransferase [Desulfosarcina alkanivorans]BBO71803.1 ribosomal RNA small subunit methyltransferase I [Desulfosarcina alkanivorans]